VPPPNLIPPVPPPLTAGSLIARPLDAGASPALASPAALAQAARAVRWRNPTTATTARQAHSVLEEPPPIR
jgi:hypothetical protein